MAVRRCRCGYTTDDVFADGCPLCLRPMALVNDAGFAALQVLVTEILPARRGAMMSFYLLSWGVAITTAPLVGGLLWNLGGFAALVLGMSLAGGLAFLLALRWLPRTVGAASGQLDVERAIETA